MIAKSVVRALQSLAEQVLALLGFSLAASHYAPQQLPKHPVRI